MKKKVKICFVIDAAAIGGASLLTFEVINKLNKDIFDIGLVILFDSVNSDSFIRENLPKNVHLFLLSLDNIGKIKSLAKLFNILKEYDIVDSSLEYSNLFCSILNLLLLGKTRFIVTMHGLDAFAIEDRYLNQEIKSKWSVKHIIWVKYIQYILFKFCAKVIPVSNSIKMFLISKGIKPEKIEVAYHGIDIKRFNEQSNLVAQHKLKEKYKIKDGDFVIGYVGRLSYAKGLEELIENLHIMFKNYDNIKLILIGDGERRSYLMSLIETFSINDKCIITGFVDNLIEHYKLLNLFILPSFSEGIPLTLLEAMYLNKIVLCSNVGGIPEVITNGVNGFLFIKGDFNQMNELIKFVYLNKNILTSIQNIAHHTVVNKFDINNNINKLSSIFQNIANKNN